MIENERKLARTFPQSVYFLLQVPEIHIYRKKQGEKCVQGSNEIYLVPEHNFQSSPMRH